jgi:ABC-type glycerol-3-phosphate transport system permease component
MKYKTKEKIKTTFGFFGMAIIVICWIYPVFFLLVNANKTSAQYSKGDKTEIIFGNQIFENMIKAWNIGLGDGVLNSVFYG